MLSATNIHKSYDNGKKSLAVLKGITLEIKEGEFIGICGPSGAGKSTLLHILGGLDSPDQGRVLLAEEDIYKLSDAALCRIRNEKIGFVFQFYHLLSELNVLENVMIPALIGRSAAMMQGHTAKEDALALLEEVGLKERVRHFPNQLSGGERQRVAIVRGLINRPRFLLCDEPTGNLDSRTGEEIISLLNRISVANRMGVALVTHNPGLVKSADRVYHLRDGILER